MRHLILAILSGLLLVTAWPTYGFPPLLFIAFVPLLVALHQLRDSKKKVGFKVFNLGFITFFIWNITTTYWLYFSTPFGMWFAVLANSFLMTLVVFIHHKLSLKRLNFFQSYLLLVLLWIGFEYMHLNWEFSWPWLNLGNAFSEYTSWIQWYEYTGTLGGTLWVWVANLLVFKSVLLYLKFKDKAIVARGAVKLGLCIGIPLIISVIILNTYQTGEDIIEVVILQPNIDPYNEKYNTTDQRINTLLTELATKKITSETDLILTPETVFADNTALTNFNTSEAEQFSQNLISKYSNLSVLSGISMYDYFRQSSRVTSQSNAYRNGGWYDDYNSAFFENLNTSTQFYHKSKLVPGVENLPYASVIKPVLGNLMIDMGGTVSMKTTQDNRSAFQLINGSKTGSIICYESVYGEFVTGYVREGAQMLSIITNDAWWSNTLGHKQHFSYARLRAIETRRSIARSANTGISGFITETGAINETLGYEKQGALRGMVTINDKITFYVKYGDYIARIALFILVLLILYAITKRRSEV